MSDPGYDFFATGRPQVPPGSPALPEPPVAAPLPPPVAPSPAPAVQDVVYNAPPAAAQFRRADGVMVNQFGTPIGVESAPVGPYAAPGVAAAATAAPGMVSTWGAAPALAPAPAPGRSAQRAVSSAPSTVGAPRNVRAVAILALFFAALLAWATFGTFMAYQQLSSGLDAAGGSSPLGEAVLSALLVGTVLLALVTSALVAGGAATLAGHRWGGWVLVAAYGLYLVAMMQQFAAGGFQAFDLIFVLIAIVLLLVLLTGEGLAWLTGRRA